MFGSILPLRSVVPPDLTCTVIPFVLPIKRRRNANDSTQLPSCITELDEGVLLLFLRPIRMSPACYFHFSLRPRGYLLPELTTANVSSYRNINKWTQFLSCITELGVWLGSCPFMSSLVNLRVTLILLSLSSVCSRGCLSFIVITYHGNLSAYDMLQGKFDGFCFCSRSF